VRLRLIPVVAAVGLLSGALAVLPVHTVRADTFPPDPEGGCVNQTYTVPSGVVAVNVTLIGSAGQDGGGSSGHTGGVGGLAAIVTGQIPVTAGETLFAAVAGLTGGYGPSSTTGNGGFGGKGSVITTGDSYPCTSTATTFTPLVIAAGGGGGGGGDAFGSGGIGGNAGAAGNNAGDNQNIAGGGGAAASSTAGGGGGAGGHGDFLCGTADNGGNGKRYDAYYGSGGDGGTGCNGGGGAGGGGGGGGYYGGGGGGGSGGAGGGGGGGGRSWAADSLVTNVTYGTTAPGTYASISIDPGVWSTSTILSATPNPSATTDSVTFTAGVSNAAPTPPGGGSVHFTATQGATTVDMGTGTVSGGHASVAYTLAPGFWSVTAHYSGDSSDTASTSAPPYRQTMGTAPVVKSSPQDATVTYPAAASFTATATGDPAPTLQWQDSFDGTTWTDIPGATSSPLQAGLNCAEGCDHFKYRAVFANPVGSASSSYATLTVHSAPFPGNVPVDQRVPVGGSAVFTATTESNPLASAQWQISTDAGSTWNNVVTGSGLATSVLHFASPSDQTFSELTLTSISAGQNGEKFRVIFTNSLGTFTTGAATLTLFPSCIVANPTPTNFSHCHGVDLSGLDLSGAPLRYGDLSDANLSGANLHATSFGQADLSGANLTGATGPYANFTGARLTGALLYNGNFDQANFTNANLTGAKLGGATMRNAFLDGATLTNTQVIPADVTGWSTGADVVVTWPAPFGVTGTVLQSCDHDSGSLFPLGDTTVTCAVAAPPDVIFPGAVFLPGHGTFVVHVVPPVAPVVTAQPADTTAEVPNAPATATLFIAQASGGPPPTVQWQASTDGGVTYSDVAGATSVFFSIASTTLSMDGTKYRAVFTNIGGTATSNVATLHVVKTPITVMVSGSQSFGGSPTFTTTDDSAIVGGSVSGVLSCASAIDGHGTNPPPAIDTSLQVGSYTVIGLTCGGLFPADPANYSVRYFGVLGGYVVSPATITVNVKGSQLFGGTPTFQETDDAATFGGGAILTGRLQCTQVDGAVAIDSTLPIGHHTVVGLSCQGLAPVFPLDYAVSYVGVTDGFTVLPGTVTVHVWGSQTFGGTPSFQESDDAASIGLTLSGILSCTAVEPATPITPALPVNAYTVSGASCSGLVPSNPAANVQYVGMAGQFVVAPALLAVAAKATSTTYGTVPSFDATVNGLVNGDTFKSLGGSCGDAGASTTLAPGTYVDAITCSGVSSANYAVTYSPGTLTVLKESLSITANPKSMTYGGKIPPSFDAVASGLVNADTFKSLGGSCASATASSSLAAGPYPGAITCTGANPANYDITYYPGNLMVNRATLTVTADSTSMTYGGTVPVFSATLVTLVNGDTFVALGGSCSDAGASATLPVGTYTDTNPITCGGVNPANYSVTYSPGTLTVNSANLTVTADNQAMAYGDAVPSLTNTVTGFVNAQTLATSGVTGAASCLTAGTPSSPATTYPITCTAGTLSASNYSFPPASFVPGTLTIGKHGATVGYTGNLFWSTGSSSVSTGTVTLQGMVTPSAGGTVDVTKSGITFLLFKSSNLTMAAPDYTCTASSVGSTGVATCTMSGLAVDNWTVVATIPGSNAYFRAPNADPAVVSLYQPTTGTWATGGGWVSDPSSTVSSTNRHANFGFNVRYTSTGAPKGQSVFAFRGADGYDYVVKSNSWQGGGLAVSTTGTGFSGKATVTVIDPTTGLPVTTLGGGNYSFRVDATQNATTPSTYAISVYTSTGVLWHRAGTTSVQLPLGGGNIVIHSH
jgi:uncharacterized protein YjbI with pentapeptide repeats